MYTEWPTPIKSKIMIIIKNTHGHIAADTDTEKQTQQRETGREEKEQQTQHSSAKTELFGERQQEKNSQFFNFIYFLFIALKYNRKKSF